MPRKEKPPEVLIDTNVLISGLVFGSGNEHEVLRLAEAGMIRLVVPEYVLAEARRVLARRFPGFQGLLDVYLSRAGFREVPREATQEHLGDAAGKVRDPKDTAVLASVLAAKPRYFVTGDKDLREDVSMSVDPRITEAVSSRELIERCSE